MEMVGGFHSECSLGGAEGGGGTESRKKEARQSKVDVSCDTGRYSRPNEALFASISNPLCLLRCANPPTSANRETWERMRILLMRRQLIADIVKSSCCSFPFFPCASRLAFFVFEPLQKENRTVSGGDVQYVCSQGWGGVVADGP